MRSDTLDGHTEDLNYLVHRHPTYGDYWVLIPEDSDREDVTTFMRDRQLGMGGALFEVRARATVYESTLLVESEPEDDYEV